MATLIERAIGAARLDATVYEEIEADAGALGQAMTVVAAAAVASGIGSSVSSDVAGPGIVFGILGALIGWFVWALTVYVIGAKAMPEPSTHADMGQLLRTTGFAAAPGVAGIVGVVPGIGGLLLLVVSLWQLAAMVIAVRQALDYTSTGRAVAVCVIGFVAQIAVIFAIALVGAGLVAATLGGAAGGAPSVTP